MDPVNRILHTKKGARYSNKSFTAEVYKKMSGKGWFRVRDVVPLYITRRNVTSWNERFMSGDASWRLKLMTDSGILERKPNPKARGHYLYRVR